MGGARSSVLALTVVLAALASAPAAASAAPCTDEFTGSNGGSWADASNWSGGVPGPSSVVCWDSSETVRVDEGTQHAGSVASGGGLIVGVEGRLALGTGGESSSLDGTVQVEGALTLGGSLACARAVIEDGTLVDDGEIGCPATVARGGRLGGAGVLASLVNEAGVVEPGDAAGHAALRVSGDYRQDAAATLVVRSGAPDAAATDSLQVGGSVVLDGTVSLQLEFLGVVGESFPVIGSDSAPQGAFAGTTGYAPGGEPWGVEYGSAGAQALYVKQPFLHPSISGTAQPGGVLLCGVGPWSPAGLSYSWRLEEPRGPLYGGTRAVQPREAFAGELEKNKTPTLALTGQAFGRVVGCGVETSLQVTGAAAVRESALARPVSIDGPYHNLTAPSIHGKAFPGAKLTCSPGRWEAAPTGFTYGWGGSTWGVPVASERAQYVVPEIDEAQTVTCTVTAHYGGIEVAAETSVEIPARAQPTLCPRRPIALVSGRRSGSALLLFGAAEQRYIGDRVIARSQSEPGRAWRRIAVGQVNRAGYFELRAPLHAGAPPAGAYRVEVAGVRSRALELPGLLQIGAVRAAPGTASIELRLDRAAGRSAQVTVAPLARGCTVGGEVASARLSPGGTLRVHLTAPRGAGPAVFLAKARAGRRSVSVELIVPARPLLRPLAFDLRD